jgi:hypothetical protein
MGSPLNSFTLEYRHTYLADVRVVITVQVDRTFQQVAEDATEVMELGDDFIEGGELPAHLLELVKITTGGIGAIVVFNHGDRRADDA